MKKKKRHVHATGEVIKVSVKGRITAVMIIKASVILWEGYKFPCR